VNEKRIFLYHNEYIYCLRRVSVRCLQEINAGASPSFRNTLNGSFEEHYELYSRSVVVVSLPLVNHGNA
jgi:hypothetical protein